MAKSKRPSRKVGRRKSGVSGVTSTKERIERYRIQNAILRFELRDDPVLEADHKLEVLEADFANTLPIILGLVGKLVTQVAGSAPAGLDQRLSIVETVKQIHNALRGLREIYRLLAGGDFVGQEEQDSLARAAEQLLRVVRALRRRESRESHRRMRRTRSK
jgi:hypothetical protein